jgi:hypothetical protein
MKRTLNYTGRMKIKRENVSINFIRQNNNVVAFTVDKLDLNDLTLPPDGRVYVEAYYRTDLKRYDFGTAGSIRYHSSCDLRDIASPENAKFRILVANPSDGKIVAYTDRISPEESAEKKTILPVQFSDLGNEIWQVKYEGEEDSPILIINNRIPNIQNIAKQDAQFFIYVYPGVIREILSHMIFVDVLDSTTDPSTGWHGDWLNFVERLGVEPPETLNKDDKDNFSEEDAIRWISDSVTAFCDIYSNKFHEFIKKLEEMP